MFEIYMTCPDCDGHSWEWVKVNFDGKEVFRCSDCGELHTVEEMEYKTSKL